MNTPEVRDVRKSHLIDPSSFFPYEIFASIICFTISDDPNGPLPFLSVSNQWQRILLDTPKVWTNIEVDNSEEVVQRTAAFLHLSQNYLIDLRITTPLNTMQHLDPLIQERHRIRKLTVSKRTRNRTTYNPQHTRSSTDILEYMAQYPYYSQLEEIVDESLSIQIPPKLLALCPKLAIITGSKTYFPYIPSLSRTIRELEYQYNKPSEIDALAQNGFAFTSLTLIDSCLGRHPPEYVKFAVLDQNTSTLRHFKFFTPNSHSLLEDFIIRQLPCRLQSLSIHLPTDCVYLFVVSLQFLSYLTDLKLTLVESNRKSKVHTVPDGESDGRPVLRNLTIDDHTTTTERLGLKAIVQAFSVYECLRGIDRVSLLLKGGIPELSLTTPLLEASIVLRTLHVNVSRVYREIYLKDEDVMIKPALMPSVEELTVNKVDYLHVLQAPNVARLYIEDYTDKPSSLAIPKGFGGRLSQIKIDAHSFNAINKSYRNLYPESPWNKVHDITWKVWNASCEPFTASFSSLTSITLPPYHDANPRQTPINALFITLLDRSRPCPSLHTICSANYPHWELLFAVLYDRSRNNEDTKVQPIRALRLPFLPVGPILNPLVDLLKGHAEGLTAGIDNLIRRRIFNKNIDACNYCLLSGYVQCYTKAEVDYLDDTKVLELLEFSSQYLSNSTNLTFNTDQAHWKAVLDDDTLPLNASGYSCKRHFGSQGYYDKFITINSFTSVALILRSES